MIGKTIYVFDINRRKYPERNGRPFGSPIYREHWVPRTITHETATSWILGGQKGEKIPKAGDRNVCFSKEELDQRCYVEENRLALADLVRRTSDYTKLKQIAEILEYDPSAAEEQ